MSPLRRVWLLAAARLVVSASAIGAALVMIPRDRPFDEGSLPARVSLDERREKQPEDDPRVSLALPSRSPEEWRAKHEDEDETRRRRQEQMEREVERMMRAAEKALGGSR